MPENLMAAGNNAIMTQGTTTINPANEQAKIVNQGFRIRPCTRGRQQWPTLGGYATQTIKKTVVVDHATVAHQRDVHPSCIEFMCIGYSFVVQDVIACDLNVRWRQTF